MTQLCLSQCMTSHWCNHSDHCCNHSDHFITIGHQQQLIVSSSFINQLDKNSKINSQLSNETRHIFHHINEYMFSFFKLACDKSRNTFIDTTLVCYIVNEHTTKCSRYKHYSDTIMVTMAYQITNLTILNSTVYSGADQRKHQSSASLAWIPRTNRQ